MADLIQDYPQSSCNCYKCSEKFYDICNNGKPTNMSVRNCNFSKYYDCVNTKLFKNQIEPKVGDKYTFLNSEGISQQYDKRFIGIDPKITRSYDNIVYIPKENDSRIFSSTHGGEVMALDRPPISSNITEKTIYTDPTFKEYGKMYGDYNDIKAGQILYYLDESIQDTLYKPLFINSANIDGIMYKDPMGSFKPQYNRTPVKIPNLLETTHNNNHGELTWLRDSQETREDLLASQMNRNNKNKYSSRWTGNIFF
jgi:hypothetical protein